METSAKARQLIERARESGRNALDEPTSKRILGEYGIRAPRSVVIKTDDAEAVKASIDDISQRCRDHGYTVDGFLLEEMVNQGHEIVIGGYRDDTFGPVMMFGLGGIFVEVLQDVTFRICPITEADAREMIQDLRGAALLKGVRGGISVPDEVIVNALLAVGGEQGFFFELTDLIKELDINPLLANEQEVIALDARIVL
jgi:acetyl-CoA synthetase (ADP-forming)